VEIIDEVQKCNDHELGFHNKCGVCKECRNNQFCVDCGKKLSTKIGPVKCKSCVKNGKVNSEEHCSNIRKAQKLINHNPHTIVAKEKISTGLKKAYKNGAKKPWQYVHPDAKAILKDISIKNKNKKISEETRKKLRVASSKNWKKKYRNFPNYNKSSISIIEEYGKEHGFKFQHAESSVNGEHLIASLGYFVDGYDKENNVVIEYYEKAHNKSKVRDEKRRDEIMRELNCDFIVIHENGQINHFAGVK
jgi:hypothetical protein